MRETELRRIFRHAALTAGRVVAGPAVAPVATAQTPMDSMQDRTAVDDMYDDDDDMDWGWIGLLGLAGLLGLRRRDHVDRIDNADRYTTPPNRTP